MYDEPQQTGTGYWMLLSAILIAILIYQSVKRHEKGI